MSGQLDQISEAIGHLRGSVGALDRTLEQHCDDDDRRHRENIAAMKGIGDALDRLNDTVAPLVMAIAEMQPQFQKWQRLGWKLSGLVGFGAIILAGMVWLAEQAISLALHGLFPPPRP